MAAVTQKMTPAEYLAIERQSETRNEYFAGEVFAMSGASRKHNLITSNLNRVIGDLLKDRRCEVYSTDMRVRIPNCLYTYPDVVVVCDEPTFDDEHVDTLLNPVAIIEVLSPSTKDYDRGTKFTHYRQIKSLREFVLVDSEAPKIEQCVLKNGVWQLQEFEGLSTTLDLSSIACQVPLTEIYRKVAFSESP